MCECRRRAFQGQVTGADFDQPRDALVQIDQDRFGDDQFIRAENVGETAQPGAEIAERQARDSDDSLPVDGHDPAFRTQARAGAVGTGLGDQEFFQFVAVIGLVDVFVDVFSVATQQIGGDAFEASLADGGWRLDMWEVAAKEVAVYAKEQQVALRRGVVFDRKREVEFKPVMGSGCLQGGGIVVDVKEVPTSNSAIRDALLLVDQAFDVGLMDAAQPGAGWTGPGGFIKREVSHADLWNRRATMWAGKGFFRSGGIVVRAGFTLPFRVGRVEGGRDIFSTGWAGAVSQASKQHAQIGIDIGGSAKRGTWASVGKMLVHADRWGKPGDGVDRGFRQPEGNQSKRFHVLALAFFMQDVEPQGGFARTGHTGQDCMI